MKFGTRLKAGRNRHKLTADDLAKKCGVSRSYITLIENGRRMPGRKIIPKIASALKVKTSIIVNWYLEEVREKFKGL